jgi:phage tail-like protein
MRPTGPTFWLLDGRAGWRTAAADGVVAAAGGLRLAATADGPRGLGDPAGTLGGLRVPPWLAVAGADRFLLDPGGGLVRRLGAPAPVLGGRDGAVDDRSLQVAAAIAARGSELWVADPGQRRVLVFGLPALELRLVLPDPEPAGPAPGEAVPGARGGWQPVDVVTGAGAAWLLDRAGGQVWRYDGELHLALSVPEAAGRWARLAVDRAGVLYLHDPVAGTLAAYQADPGGGPAGPAGVFTDPADVIDRFDPPAVRVIGEVLVLSDTAAVDRTGASVPVPRLPGAYRTAGTWVSEVMDSRLYRCVWDRIELAFADLPVGAAVHVSTALVSDVDDPLGPADDRWAPEYAVTGVDRAPGTPYEPSTVDWPVFTEPGRWLAVRLRLAGTGLGTPVVAGIRLRYPRASYLDFLPAVFAADDLTGFLDRFLGGFRAEWEGLQGEITDLPRLADPRAVPAGPALAFLASWFGVTLDARWSPQRQRDWLLANLAVLGKRGTPAAVRSLLAAFLSGQSGQSGPDGGYPVLVERFRERAHPVLSGQAGARGWLWSPGVAGRLQPGTYATVGQARLVSVGDAAHDVFDREAHRFRVFVPASWVPTRDDEQALRRVLDAEKPASAQAELCLVEPRLRVSVQSTVGLDTIVAAVPKARLQYADPAGQGADAPAPSRPPSSRLGIDFVLTGGERGLAQVGRTTRVGVAASPGTGAIR